MSELTIDYMLDKLVDVMLNEIFEWKQIDDFDHNVITFTGVEFGRVTIEIEKKG